MGVVRILIADDHELVRRGLISILHQSHPEWEIVVQAANGGLALELAAEHQPSLAILDLSMPDINGLEVATRLFQIVPGIRILILTMHAAAPILHQLRKAGVSAYLAKNEAPQKLVLAVEKVLTGEPFFASVSASRREVDLEPGEYVPAQFLLTLRELEVMRMLAGGHSNKELAARLDMSVRTAETHHSNILAKLNVESIGQLVRIAVRDRVI